MRRCMEGIKGTVDEDTKEMIVHGKLTVYFYRWMILLTVSTGWSGAVLTESRIKAIVAYVEVPYGGMDINLNTDFSFKFHLQS